MAKTVFKELKFNIVMKKLEEAFSIGASIAEACCYAEISRDTFYRWTKEKKGMMDKFEMLKQKPILKARQSVVGALSSNPELALKFLERKRKNEFSLRQEVTAADGRDFIPNEEVRKKVGDRLKDIL